MASYSVATSKRATLTGTTADNVEITGIGEGYEVVNEGTTSITVVHAIGSAPSAPTLGQDNSTVVLAGGSIRVTVAHGANFGGNLNVGVVGSGNAYAISNV